MVSHDSNPRRSWTKDEDNQLRRLYAELAPDGRLGEIGNIVGRSRGAVRHRASRLGITNACNPRPRGERNYRWSGGLEASRERQRASEAAQRRARGAREARQWLPDEDEALSALGPTTSINEIAGKLNRSPGSVRARMGRLRVRGRGTSWQVSGEDHHNWKGGKTAAFRRMKYQLEPTAFDLLLASQGNVCAICQRDGHRHKKGWAVDHDHVTSQIRGVLCCFCNLILGHAKDDVRILQAAITYLETHNTTTLPVSDTAV